MGDISILREQEQSRILKLEEGRKIQRATFQMQMANEYAEKWGHPECEDEWMHAQVDMALANFRLGVRLRKEFDQLKINIAARLTMFRV